MSADKFRALMHQTELTPVQESQLCHVMLGWLQSSVKLPDEAGSMRRLVANEIAEMKEGKP